MRITLESGPLSARHVEVWRYSSHLVTRNHPGWGIAVLVLAVTFPLNHMLLLGASQVRRLLGSDSGYCFCPLTYFLDHSLGQSE